MPETKVIKDGCIILNIPISDRSHYLLGRNADICDLVLDHQSISRQHAVLQFKEGNELFIFDLGSAQGTKVNKKSMPPNEYHKLLVGDVISFGASSRLYVLNGPAELMPAEYDSKNTRLVRKQMAEMSSEIAKKKEQESSLGVSWGFGEDAENSSGDEDDDKEDKTNLPDYIKNDPNYDRKFGKKYTSDLKDAGDVNEKDKELVEKIKTRERKIQNMQEENKKIFMKESSQDGGLTEGQEIAVSRNDNRIQVLIEEIEALQHELGLKTQQRNSTAISNSKGKSKTRDDNGDDLLDTTGETVDASTNWRLRKKLNASNRSVNKTDLDSSGTWTYESLCESKLIESKILSDFQLKIAETNSKIIHESDFNIQEVAIDDVIKQTESLEAKSDLKKLLILETEQLKKLGSIEKLLKIATPAITSLVNLKVDIKESPSAPISIVDNLNDEKISESKSRNEGVKTNTLISENIIFLVPDTNCEPDDNAMKKKNPNEAMATTSGNTEETSDVLDNDEKRLNKKRRIIGPSMSDNVALTKSNSNNATNKVTVKSRNNIRDREDSLTFEDGVLQGGDVAWVPPVGQTGSGFTSLNDKFGY